MSERIAGLAYQGHSLMSGYWHTVKAPDPTHCEQCHSPVNKTKALRRYHRTAQKPSTTMGLCACGAWMFYR